MEAAVNSLSDEILEIIFSYCTHSDLVQSIQNVCCRWREVSQGMRVWKNVTYCPESNARPEQIVEMLKMSPKLQNIILNSTYDCRVLQAITDNCPELRKLEISVLRGIGLGIHMNFLRNLQEKCPKIKYLKIPHLVLTDKWEVVGKFTNLQVLHFTGRTDLMIYLLFLKPVANYCKKLEHLELEHSAFKVNQLRYLLTTRKDTLHTLGVSCCDESGECVLPALSTCELKSLSLFNYSDCRRNHEKVEHFGRLKTVKELSITSFASEDDLKQIFENENMAQLMELSLGDSSSFDNDLAEVIVRNCPLLKKISLKFVMNMNDASLQIMTNLKELNSLTLCSNFFITDRGILHLQDVRSLKHLRILQCEVRLKNIPKLSSLQDLSLQGEDLSEFPWDLIPHHLQSLRYLCFSRCRNVDMSAIQKLRVQLPCLKVDVFHCS